MKFAVLGAGIVGVNSALQLQDRFPNAEISLLSDKFCDDTVSSGAAGIFRPGSSFSGPTPEITREWIEDSYQYYDELARSSESAMAGISQVGGYVFSSKFASICKNKYLEKLLPVYRAATNEELKLCPGNWKYGAFFQTMIVESTKYLPWAMEKFERNGGNVKRINHVTNLVDIESACNKKIDYLVNCTGLGAKWLCKDDSLVPVRGQVFKVKAPWIKMFYYGDYDTYVIPGQSTVTLGGCRQLDSYKDTVDEYDGAAIWSRCVSLVPSLKKAKVIKEWVGLRPHRSSVRCELELIQSGMDSSKFLKVVHLYGHGGYGVTSAPGSAKYAVKLIEDSIRQKRYVLSKL